MAVRAQPRRGHARRVRRAGRVPLAQAAPRAACGRHRRSPGARRCGVFRGLQHRQQAARRTLCVSLRRRAHVRGRRDSRHHRDGALGARVRLEPRVGRRVGESRVDDRDPGLSRVGVVGVGIGAHGRRANVGVDVSRARDRRRHRVARLRRSVRRDDAGRRRADPVGARAHAPRLRRVGGRASGAPEITVRRRPSDISASARRAAL